MIDDRDITENYHGGNPRSAEAHEDTKGKKARDQARILRALGAHPKGLTCDQVETLLGIAHQTCSARFTELKAKNWILPTGERRLTKHGSKADVFVSIPKVT